MKDLNSEVTGLNIGQLAAVFSTFRDLEQLYILFSTLQDPLALRRPLLRARSQHPWADIPSGPWAKCLRQKIRSPAQVWKEGLSLTPQSSQNSELGTRKRFFGVRGWGIWARNPINRRVHLPLLWIMLPTPGPWHGNRKAHC